MIKVSRASKQFKTDVGRLQYVQGPFVKQIDFLYEAVYPD